MIIASKFVGGTDFGGGGGIDSYTKLMLHGDGIGAAFIDSEITPKTITAVGSATQSTAEFKFGGSSMYFNGGGSIYAPDSSDWDFGTGDFTIDYWVKVPGIQAYALRIWNRNTTAGDISYWNGDGNIAVGLSGVYPAILSTDPIVDTNWHHVAVVRDGLTSTKLYIDGIQTGSTYTTNYNGVSGGVFYLSQYEGGGYNMEGYIDEFRVSKGIARWTTNFTPPTSAYTL